MKPIPGDPIVCFEDDGAWQGTQILEAGRMRRHEESLKVLANRCTFDNFRALAYAADRPG